MGLIMLKHPITGVRKTVKHGFSWPMLFFGFLTPLVKGDFKWFLISLLLFAFTDGFSNFVLAFFYNGLYLQELINQGFEVI